MTRLPPVRHAFAWASLDQVLSSATNLALSIAAGRVLGPRGLGVVFVGFGAYLVALGFQRALVLQPLAVSAPDETGSPSTVTSPALTMTVIGAVASSLVLFAAGSLVTGDIGDGLRVMAPWIVPALLQDYWRWVLFRDGRGSAAAANDATWALALVVGAPLLAAAASPAAVVSWWGLGASAAALVGVAQVRVRPAPPAEAWSWWRRHSSFGGWLWLESASFYAAAQGVVLELAATVGAAGLGGLRAVESVLTPLSLLKPAAELPGLPAMAAAHRRSKSEASALAVAISATLAALVAVYMLLAAVVAESVLARVFGPEFAAYDRLVVPLGVAQLATALAVGPTILLKAAQRGRALAASGAAGGIASLALVWPLAAGSGLVAAAWGLAAATSIAAALTIVLAWTAPRSRLEAQA